jgi:serine/threonine protein phosphatase PrpC
MSDTRKVGEQQREHGCSPYGYYTIVRVQGASHLKNNQPCQDAFTYLADSQNNDPLIVAIADGHGDKRYDMSQYGSKIATEVAVNILKQLYEQLRGSKTYLFRSFRDHFLKEVIKEWRKAVLQHADKNGLSIEEPSEVYTRYGTTLLVALISQDEALIGQIGDGDIVIVDGQDKLIVPFHQEEDLIGNATYSLCSTEANRFWKITRIDNPMENKFMMMSTDGLSNCFEDDVNFHKFVYSLMKHVERYNISFIETLPELLFEYSQKGSGDDITLALLEFKKPDSQSIPKANTVDVKKETTNSSNEEISQASQVLQIDSEYNGYKHLTVKPLLNEKYRRVGKHLYKPEQSYKDECEEQFPKINIRFKKELQ